MNSIKIIDILSGKNVSGYYKLYNCTQWYSKDEMQTYQLSKLRLLLKHCYDNVPFYRDIMVSNNIRPEDVRDVTILKNFPILTKEIIKANYERFIPTNIKKIKGVKTSQTGGTTGNILYKRNDAQTRSSVWATYERFHDWMGIKKGDLSLSYLGGHVVKNSQTDILKSKIIRKLKNKIIFDAYDTKEETFRRLIDVLSKNEIKLISSYAQALYVAAKKMDEMNLHFNVKSIVTTAEPLMLQHRDLFKKVFNAESFDQYGCGEIEAIAYECSAHEGLHVSEERVLLETNEKNELIITDLDNFTMPFIRYWNADQAIFSDSECSCGRKSRLIKKVLGRTCDYLVGINGQVLHWAYFWHLMFDTEIAIRRKFIKFQIVQVADDTLHFRMVSETLSSENKAKLTSLICEKMGDMRVEFIQENDIENSPSGKYRPVVNRLL